MTRNLLLSILTLFSAIHLNANDGGFYVDGNQLIPMIETNISVRKEILTINKSLKNPTQAEVSVYYEFYNPDEPKTMVVGFEATSPYGDANSKPVNGEQPYIHTFTVDMNGKRLPYQVAIVSDSIYYKNGAFNILSKKEIEDLTDDYSASFMYVYHFQAHFKKGLNIIQHTYTCDFSTFVMSNYELGYILSAALRWGNQQIDDFTLNINMGDDQLINIPKSFYDSVNEWTVAGIGKKRDTNIPPFYGSTSEGITTGQFYVKNGYLIFQKRNFKPKGELQISSPRDFIDLNDFDYRNTPNIDSSLAFWDVYGDLSAKETMDDTSKKILRNLPFAKRGYIFSTPELQKYYEQQIWYIPDSGYKSDLSKLSPDEQKWIQYWGK